METLASGWACDPHDLTDLEEEPSSVWDQCDFNSSPPPHVLMWTNQLSPHLHRNKQLQDTLLQREEELARLQEENNKLRQFFSSSFVRNLQLKAKKLSADGKKKLKRNLMYDRPLQTSSHHLMTSQSISKRVCRNLTAEFCSESPEASPEPNLDLWVLRTLGLKDRDTIDTSGSSGYSSVVPDAPASEYSLNSSFDSSDAASSPSSVHSYCPTSTPQAEYRFRAEDSGGLSPASASQSCFTPQSQCSDFTATGLKAQFGSPEDVIGSFSSFTASQTPQQDPRADCPQITASSPVQSLTYWSALRSSHTEFSPPREGVCFSPIAASSPIINQSGTPVHGGSPTSPSGSTPQRPRSRTDLAFSMCLSPTSSVKTHSFPQGQAFVRKDTGGSWNFTWVPRQGP